MRLRKRWRYVGIWSPTVSLCAARVSVGPATQEFWGVWDRRAGLLDEHTRRLPGRVRLPEGRLDVGDGGTRFDVRLDLDQASLIEVTTPGDRTWTRKRIGRATGSVRIGSRSIDVDGVALVDDSDGHHPRHTEWWWSAGCGTLADGRAVAWNLVSGINDTAGNSENTVWVDGEPTRVAIAAFDEDLTAVHVDDAALRFESEAERAREENLLVVASSYRQPFGTFSGTLPGGLAVVEGYGVMEHHSAVW